MEFRAARAQPCRFLHRHACEHHVGFDRRGDLDIRDTLQSVGETRPRGHWRAPHWSATDPSPASLPAGRRRNASWRRDGRRACGDIRNRARLRYRRTPRLPLASAPALVAPKESTSTPHFQVASAGEQPRCAMALAKRAPSMCSFRPRRWASSPIAVSSDRE